MTEQSGSGSHLRLSVSDSNCSGTVPCSSRKLHCDLDIDREERATPDFGTLLDKTEKGSYQSGRKRDVREREALEGTG